MTKHDVNDQLDDPVLTTSAAARLLGVAVSTAQQWIESGTLDSWKTPGGHRRVRLSAVMKLIEKSKGGVATSTLSKAGAMVLDQEFLPVSRPGYPVPADEAARLKAVANAGLIDTPPEQVFDRLTWLATQIAECQIALFSVLTSKRQWFKSRVGLPVPETTRDVAFCSHAILQDTPFIVEDATLDPRFRDNPLVTGAPFIRLYAGFPIRGKHGHHLGTLCVLHNQPKHLSEEKIRALQELAAIASEEVGRRGGQVRQNQ